jgi:hypothetical protein
MNSTRKSQSKTAEAVTKSAEDWHKYWREYGFPYVAAYLNPQILFRRLRDIATQPHRIRRYIAYTQYRLKEAFQLPRDVSLQWRGRYVSVYVPLSDYEKMDILVDNYTEHSRIQVKKNPADISLYEHYMNGGLLANVIQLLLSRRMNPGNVRDMREMMYDKEFKYIYNASAESVIFYICMWSILFSSTSQAQRLSDIVVLDGAGGYGSRLLASLVLGCRAYHGVEPNTMSTPGFARMIQELGGSRERQQHYRMYEDGLPDARAVHMIPDGSVDLVMFSPPLFTGEVYSTDAKQSTIMFKSFDEWRNGFLYKSLDVLWSKLKIGGYIVFQSMRYDYIHYYVASQLQRARYLGVIARKTYAGRYKPNWIWTKTH